MAIGSNRFAGIAVATAVLLSNFPALAAADIAYGEYLANECVTCHQRSGNYSGIPSITGWPAETFVQALNTYRWRERTNPIMQTIADQLTDADMAALAAYFEQLGPPQLSSDEPAPGKACGDAPTADGKTKTC
ncbi:MAG: c-type cytochrome [Hyphomicrobiaceae bacterium]